MINAIIGITSFIALMWTGLLIAWAMPRLVSYAHKPKIDPKKTPIQVNYWKIARLEIEIFGETKPNVDSPIAPWCKSQAEIHGIDSTGHLKDGSCNLNASMGPACSKIVHYKRRQARAAPIMNPLKVGINPYADREYDDPNWVDDDGRPW